MSPHLSAMTVKQVEEIIGLAEARVAHLVSVIDLHPTLAKAELLALFLLGLGTLGEDTGRWQELVRAARSQMPEDVAAQLASHSTLAEGLRRGLALLRA